MPIAGTKFAGRFAAAMVTVLESAVVTPVAVDCVGANATCVAPAAAVTAAEMVTGVIAPKVSVLLLPAVTPVPVVSVTVVPLIAVMYSLAGMPGPLTAWPMTSPAVFGTVTFA